MRRQLGGKETGIPVSTVLKAMCFYWETGLTYFSCHSRQVDAATWSFLVLPIDKVHHTLAYIDRNLPLGDNRGTVKTSTTPHISDQLGTENACKTLLCWVIVMIRVLVCNNMYRYKHHFGSFYHNPAQSEDFRGGFDSLPVNRYMGQRERFFFFFF